MSTETHLLRREVTHADKTVDLSMKILNEMHHREEQCKLTDAPLRYVEPKPVEEISERFASLYKAALIQRCFTACVETCSVTDTTERITEKLFPAYNYAKTLGSSGAVLEKLHASIDQLVESFCTVRTAEKNRSNLESFLSETLGSEFEYEYIKAVRFTTFGVHVLFDTNRAVYSNPLWQRPYYNDRQPITISAYDGGSYLQAANLEKGLVADYARTQGMKTSSPAYFIEQALSGEKPTDLRLQLLSKYTPADRLNRMSLDFLCAAAAYAECPWERHSGSVFNVYGTIKLKLADRVTEQVQKSVSLLNQAAKDQSNAEELKDFCSKFSKELVELYKKTVQGLAQAMFVSQLLGYEAYQETLALVQQVKPSDYHTTLVEALKERYGTDEVEQALRLFEILNDDSTRGSTKDLITDLESCLSSMNPALTERARAQIAEFFSLKSESHGFKDLASETSNAIELFATLAKINKLTGESEDSFMILGSYEKDAFRKLVVEGIQDNWSTLLSDLNTFLKDADHEAVYLCENLIQDAISASVRNYSEFKKAWKAAHGRLPTKSALKETGLWKLAALSGTGAQNTLLKLATKET